MAIREQYEEMERSFLAPQASLSAESRGREHPLADCDIRTAFQRDRDRVLHCKSFRRLKHKTQVFISPEGDHYRTRLTHTLEVSQIARTIARALRLNEDLTEAIALGHDLGHTPFGHTGERLLNSLASNGFKHNLHSLRVVEVLEGGTGLNLTWEVRDGIANHTKRDSPSTLEGAVVNLSDRIAYINHDIDDALRAQIIAPEDLPADCIRQLGEGQGARINAMVRDVIANSNDLKSIRMSGEMAEVTETLRDFMFARVYVDSQAKSEERKAMHVLQEIFQYFMEYPAQLPEEYRENIARYGEEQVVCDYIAGMTDRYAMKVYERLFIPSSWQL
jgi:dGTPase